MLSAEVLGDGERQEVATEAWVQVPHAPLTRVVLLH